MIIERSNSQKLAELKNEVVVFVDNLQDQLEELCEIRNPELRDDKAKMSEMKNKFVLENKDKFVYFYIPSRKSCHKILEEEWYFELRTARNKNLITLEEQNKFRKTKVAFAGLSVGSNMVRMCALQGGPKQINIADMDVLGLSNLNRIMAGVHDLGRKKTEVVAEYVCEVDPFLQINLFSEGINEQNVEDFVRINNELVDVIVDEVDDIKSKIALRKMADKYKKPLISVADNADGVIIEVERYDKDFTFATFAKRLEILQSFGNPQEMTIEDKARAITKFIGIENIDTDMLLSVSEVGKTLYSWPQLGGAAVLSGLVGSFLIRKIVNGSNIKSGVYNLLLKNLFNLGNKEEELKREEILKFFN
ncbi:MAG: ThiF family adenylyltransferase [Candidatus Magasanikbacteria bacterium]